MDSTFAFILISNINHINCFITELFIGLLSTTTLFVLFFKLHRISEENNNLSQDLNKILTQIKKKETEEQENIKNAYYKCFYEVWPIYRKKHEQLSDLEFQMEYAKCSNQIVHKMSLDYNIKKSDALRCVQERLDICKFDLIKQDNLGKH